MPLLARATAAADDAGLTDLTLAQQLATTLRTKEPTMPDLDDLKNAEAERRLSGDPEWWAEWELKKREEEWRRAVEEARRINAEQP